VPFQLPVLLCLQWMAKIEQHVCIKFCVKLSKSTIETPEMLHEAFGEHSLSRQLFSGIHISTLVEYQLKTNVQDDQCQQNDRKC
jgi:hypothetical protein